MIETITLGNDKIILNNAQREMINNILREDRSTGILTLREHNLSITPQFAFFGGFRAGKSFLYQLLTFVLCIIYPRLRVIYVRKTYDRLKDSVIRQFRDDFEKYGEFTYSDSSKDGSRIARFNNGSTIVFRAFDTDSGILSSEYDVAALCQAEEIQEELYKMLFGRLSGDILPHPLLLAEGNPSGNWVKSTFYDIEEEERKEKGIFFINCPTTSNLANLPPSYLTTLKALYGEQDFNRWALGSWQSLIGMVFTEFTDVNIIDPISFEDIEQNEKIMIGGDYGFRNPTAFLWGVKTYDDEIIIFDEFYKSGCMPDEIAEENLRHGKFTTVMDYSIKRPDRDGKSLWDELIKSGLRLLESNKDEKRNLIAVNSAFKQGNIKICSNCTNLIWELRHYKYPDRKIGADKNFDETPVDKDNHAIDALLYLTQALELRKSIRPEDIANRKSLKAMTIRVNNSEAKNYG
jgi:PBSX family phage terminase large subunit